MYFSGISTRFPGIVYVKARKVAVGAEWTDSFDLKATVTNVIDNGHLETPKPDLMRNFKNELTPALLRYCRISELAGLPVINNVEALALLDHLLSKQLLIDYHTQDGVAYIGHMLLRKKPNEVKCVTLLQNVFRQSELPLISSLT